MIDRVVLDQQHAHADKGLRRGFGVGRRRAGRWLGSACAELLRHDVAQRRLPHGLVQPGQRLQLLQRLPIQIVGQGAEQHRRDPRKSGITAQPPQRLDAADVGHLPVQNQQFRGFAGGVQALHGLEGCSAIDGHMNVIAHALQLALENFAIDDVVVRHQHAAAREDHRLPRGVDDLGLRVRERNVDGKGGTLPRSACHEDLAVHQLGDLLADRQPEAGAAEAPRGRAVLLDERFEDAPHAVGTNADSRVLDVEPDHEPLRRLIGAADPHNH